MANEEMNTMQEGNLVMRQRGWPGAIKGEIDWWETMKKSIDSSDELCLVTGNEGENVLQYNATPE
jgi:hypothetical protein